MPPKPKPERITLDAFVARMDDETAAKTRAIAGRIDELERRTSRMAETEASLKPTLAMGTIMTTIGLVSMLGGEDIYRVFETVIGKLGITILLAGLPVALTVYAFRLYPRSVVDNEKMKLNTNHFMPHGGLYFPPSPENEKACVVLVGTPGPKKKPIRHNRAEDIRAGRIW